MKPIQSRIMNQRTQATRTKAFLSSDSTAYSHALFCNLPITTLLMFALALVAVQPAAADINGSINKGINPAEVVEGIDLVTGNLLSVSSNSISLDELISHPNIITDFNVGQLVDNDSLYPSLINNAEIINNLPKMNTSQRITELLTPNLSSTLGHIVDYSAAIEEIQGATGQPSSNNTLSTASEVQQNTADKDLLALQQACQIVTADKPRLNFSANKSTNLVQMLQLEVRCPRGISYQVRPLHRQKLIDSTMIAIRNGQQLFPARMDIRLVNGRPLSQVTFEGNGEVQTLLISATVIANPLPPRGQIDPLGPLALILLDLSKSEP